MDTHAPFTFGDPSTVQSPYPYYAWMRREDPVHFDEKVGAWLVTRYDDVQQAVRMLDSLSSEKGLSEAHREPWQEEIDDMLRREGFGPHNTADNFNVDPPRHARRRALVDKALTAQSVGKMEDHVSRIVREITDAFIDKGHADMVPEFSIPISIYVISDLLGFPRDRLADYKRWSDAAVVPIGRGIGKEQSYKYARELMEMHHFLNAQIEARRANPTDDLISGLVHARLEEGGDEAALTLTELLSCSVALLAAGNETTRNGIAWSTYILAQDPVLFGRLRDAEDQGKALQRFVEESLRLQAPVPQLPRMAVKDCEIGGVKIPEGQFVYLCWASANHDSAKFEKPEIFDLDRKNVGQHITFGAGIHRCIGAMLARMEMKCATRELVNRLDNFKLATQDDVPIWGTFIFRGPQSIPVTFTARNV